MSYIKHTQMKLKYTLATSSCDQTEYNALHRAIKPDQFLMGFEVFALKDQFGRHKKDNFIK